MKTINTTIVHANGEAVSIEINQSGGFKDIFSMGLILRSEEPHTKQLATDAKGLQIIKDQLEYTQNECLWGLSGIGALLLAVDPVNLCSNDMENIGTLIKNLAELAHDAKDHLETVKNDIERRANLITDPEQSAHHAKVHHEAVEIRKTRSLSYADAVTMAASRLSVRLADAAATGEA